MNTHVSSILGILLSFFAISFLFLMTKFVLANCIPGQQQRCIGPELESHCTPLIEDQIWFL